jgi:hypothetical protein
MRNKKGIYSCFAQNADINFKINQLSQILANAKKILYGINSLDTIYL